MLLSKLDRTTNLQFVNAWNATPLATRVAVLVMSVMDDNPHATKAVESVVSVATVMAMQLNNEQRVEIADFMHREATALGTRWQ